MKKQNPIVILPTYCEAQNIIPMLAAIKLQPASVDVLVVDDNSPDGTANRVREFQKTTDGVYLLNRMNKEGLSKAYLDGFRWAFDREYQVVIQMDADFSHNPADIPKMLEALQGREAVFGSRYVAGGAMPDWKPFRKFISRCANFYARRALGLGINDVTGGFNVWRSSVLKELINRPFIMQGYGFLIELKQRFLRRNFEYKELPIVFLDRTHGTSKLSTRIAVEAVVGVMLVLFRSGRVLPFSKSTFTMSYK